MRKHDLRSLFESEVILRNRIDDKHGRCLHPRRPEYWVMEGEEQGPVHGSCPGRPLTTPLESLCALSVSF